MKEVDLNCWYINMPRVAQLTKAAKLQSIVKRAESISGIKSDQIKALMHQTLFKDAFLEWLRINPIDSFEHLLYSKAIAEGIRFCAYTDFRGKGLNQFAESRNMSRETMHAELYKKFQTDNEDIVLRILYNPYHFCCASAWDKLSGHSRLYIFGYVDEIRAKEVIARPYIIANPTLPSDEMIDETLRWSNYRQVFVDEIENFAEVEHEPKIANKSELRPLQYIPERDIKKAFAEIICEPDVPLDWGGENSDLFSTHLMLSNKRVSAAFMFKGPAGGRAFKPMTISELGKNGDQIERLYREPSELLILQHCHSITTPVISMMKAFACQIDNPRMFCIINGYDTLRILRAYKKCGQLSKGKPKSNPKIEVI